MSNQQSSSIIQNNERKPSEDISQPVEKNSFLSVGYGNENKDNGSKSASR